MIKKKAPSIPSFKRCISRPRIRSVNAPVGNNQRSSSDECDDECILGEIENVAFEAIKKNWCQKVEFERFVCGPEIFKGWTQGRGKMGWVCQTTPPPREVGSAEVGTLDGFFLVRMPKKN